MVVISQETFDNAVRENIEDLGLPPDEALSETIVQFELQGADLSSVIKELVISPSNSEAVKEVVNKLIELNDSKASTKEIIEKLDAIKLECNKGMQYKISAGKAGAYGAILDTLLHNKDDKEVMKSCVTTLIALKTNQPDLLDDKGIEVIFSLLKDNVDVELQSLILKWIRTCCMMHERNRQKFVERNIVDILKELLNEKSSDLLRKVLAVFRVLVLDDDIRVEFGKGHEHAKSIASKTLDSLISLFSRFQKDEELITELTLTLSSLLVRAEFCKKVVDIGGLELLRDVMSSYPESEKINRQCFKLIKALSGNDECKLHIIQKNFAPVIITALDSNKQKVQTAAAGLYSVAALSLRCPENSKVLYEAGVPEVIVDIMKMHQEELLIQKSGSWAIRNMVSRSKYQTGKFLELGVEEVLQISLKNFKEIEYDIKASLRDLGSNVELREEWTGKGGALTTGLTNFDS